MKDLTEYLTMKTLVVTGIASLASYGAKQLIDTIVSSTLYHMADNRGRAPHVEGYEEERLDINLDRESFKITMWSKKPQESNKQAILCFSGNAASPESTKRLLDEIFINHSKYTIAFISYPGGAGSTGDPTKRTTLASAEAAMKALKRKGFDEKQISVYGYSIGSICATHLAAKYAVKALILDGPLASIGHAMTSMIGLPARTPLLPQFFNWLVADNYDNIANIRKVKPNTKIIMCVGTKNELGFNEHLPILEKAYIETHRDCNKPQVWFEQGVGLNPPLASYDNDRFTHMLEDAGMERNEVLQDESKQTVASFNLKATRVGVQRIPIIGSLSAAVSSSGYDSDDNAVSYVGWGSSYVNSRRDNVSSSSLGSSSF